MMEVSRTLGPELIAAANERRKERVKDLNWVVCTCIDAIALVRWAKLNDFNKVWTPTEMVKVQRRKKGRTYLADKRVCAMPGYIFVENECYHEFRRSCPRKNNFQPLDYDSVGRPLMCQYRSLREIDSILNSNEEAALPKQITKGDQVIVLAGIYKGYFGRVVSPPKHNCRVLIGTKYVTISTKLLAPY